MQLLLDYDVSYEFVASALVDNDLTFNMSTVNVILTNRTIASNHFMTKYLFCNILKNVL